MAPHSKTLKKNSASASIQNALKKHKVRTYAELSACGATGAILKRMVEEGLVTYVGSGVYASTQLDPFVAAVLATAKYYPQAVISGFTALQIHGLAEEYIQNVDVDIPRETSIRNRMLKVHRVAKNRITGVATIMFHGGKIRIYDLERSLCEAYRLDPQGPIFFKALKRYCAMGNTALDRIAQYDKALKTHVLTHLRQELADG
jgi:predicted transcriptional regulator of viral defense system